MKRKEEKKGRKSDKSPRTGQVLGKSGRWLCQRCSRRIAEKDGDDGKVAAAGSSSEREQMCGGDPTKVESATRRRQDWNEKRAKEAEVHLAKWISLEYREEYVRRYQGTCDSPFGIEHRLIKGEMKEQFNKEAKEGWRLVADAARITDERAGSEDQQHTSGGVFVAIGSNLGAIVRADEGAIESIPGNEGRIAMSEEDCVSSQCISGTRKNGH